MESGIFRSCEYLSADTVQLKGANFEQCRPVKGGCADCIIQHVTCMKGIVRLRSS